MSTAMTKELIIGDNFEDVADLHELDEITRFSHWRFYGERILKMRIR